MEGNERDKGGRNGRIMVSGTGMNGVKEGRSGGITGGTGIGGGGGGGGEEEWGQRDSGTCSPLTPPPSSNGVRGADPNRPGTDPHPHPNPNPTPNSDRYKGDGLGVKRDAHMGNNNSTYLAALALNSNGRNNNNSNSNSNGNISQEGSGFIPDLPGVLTTVSTYQMYGLKGMFHYPYLR